MRKIKAHKQHYSFATGHEAEKYELFLKQHLLNLNPNFYGVTHKQKVRTDDGCMYVVQLSTAIEDPNLESVAEARINNQNIYLWRDRCWAIAMDQNDKLLEQIGSKEAWGVVCGAIPEDLLNNSAITSGHVSAVYGNKIVVIYPIGIDPVT